MLRYALALAAILSATSTAALAGTPVPTITAYSFGRSGGNIVPFTVAIAPTGAVTVVGPVRTTRKLLSAAAMSHLSSVVRSARFSTLPATTRCTGALPDVAANWVSSGAKKVLVHGTCNARFTTVLMALQRAVGLKYG
jgi:hypothetical protein